MVEPNRCCTHGTFALYQKHEFGNPRFFLASSKQTCCSLGRRHYLILQGGGGLVAKSCPTLAIPWSVACQAPLSMGFLRQEYWSGLPFPTLENLSDPEIEFKSPALQADSLPLGYQDLFVAHRYFPLKTSCQRRESAQSSWECIWQFPRVGLIMI